MLLQLFITKRPVFAILLQSILLLVIDVPASARIKTINSIEFGGETIKTLRDDIRQSIYVIDRKSVV